MAFYQKTYRQKRKNIGCLTTGNCPSGNALAIGLVLVKKASILWILSLLFFVPMFSGCQTVDFYTPAMQQELERCLSVPRELSMTSLPQYRIEPPDVIALDVIKLVPRQPYRIAIYDVLQIRAVGTLIDQPIDDYFLVENDGVVTLGPAYGSVVVEGLTLQQAEEAITNRLKQILRNPRVTVQLARAAGVQQITGAYQVQPDGMINLREYGMVHVAGKTVVEARAAVEQQLGRYFENPEVSVDVIGYYSKTYYIIVANAEMGENMIRLPVTGNDTVLDALSNIEGLSRVSSKVMWVARPSPTGVEEILPVNWDAIARGGKTDTNYQLMPGDRLYVVDDKLIATDNFVAKFTRPIEKLLGTAALGSQTTRSMQTLGRGYNRYRSGY